MAKKKATSEESLYEFIEYGKLVFSKLFTIWISLILLWTSTTVSNEFFKSLILITIPQLLYAYSIKAKTTLRGVVAVISVFFLLIVTSIGLIGLIGKITLLATDLGYYIAISDGEANYPIIRSANLVYIMAIVFPFIYITEWVTGYRPKGR